MVYYGTENTELIIFHGAGNPDDIHFIGMTKSCDVPTFSVKSCCDNDWGYEFYMDNNSDYERVKMTIMDAAFEAENMEELMKTLSEVFEDGFGSILVGEEEHECKCGNHCENCNNVLH